MQYVKHLKLQRETARGHGSSCLRMLMVLPLLPADYIAPGLEAVRKWAEEKKVRFHIAVILECCQNFRSTRFYPHKWPHYARTLNRIGFARWVLTSCQYSVCTIASTIQFKLLTKIWTHHLTLPAQPFGIYLVTSNAKIRLSFAYCSQLLAESITYIATRAYVKVKKRKKAATQTTETPAPPQPKACHKQRVAIITDATAQWIRTPVHLRNPLHFLQLCSHCINDTMYYTSLEDMKVMSRSEKISPPLTSLDTFTEHFTSVDAMQSSCVTKSLQHSTHQIVQTAVISSDQTQVDFSANTLATTNVTMADVLNSLPFHIITQTDPPPLAFFPKVKRVSARRPQFSKEPPPLVPIRQS